MIEIQKALNDLKWAIFSPPLMAANLKNGLFLPQQPLDQTHKTWFETVKANPNPLIKSIEKPNHKRLGLYYETLVKYYLSTFPDFKLLLYNQQVSNNKITVGAFDYIYKKISSGEIIHRESAIKLYLGIPDGPPNTSYSNHNQWWGPNCKDRLDLKLNHLTTNQIQLSQQPDGQAFLKEHNIINPHPEIDIKGYLFYPLHAKINTPKGINPEHLKGYWCEFKDIENILNESIYWAALHRLQWLAPLTLNNSDHILTPKKLKIYLSNHFKKDNTPLLIAKLNSNNHQYTESTRYFITPNNWPFTTNFN